MTDLYGIPNCDTVKKARRWLDDHGIAFEFIDFKKQAPSAALVQTWLTQIPLDKLLNKRGTTWRQLDAQAQAAAADPQAAVRLMVEHPSLIKRPVLMENDRYFIGFSEAQYRQIFTE